MADSAVVTEIARQGADACCDLFHSLKRPLGASASPDFNGFADAGTAACAVSVGGRVENGAAQAAADCAGRRKRRPAGRRPQSPQARCLCLLPAPGQSPKPRCCT